MPEKQSGKFKVEFMPSGVTAVVPPQSTIMDAAQDAGMYIGSLCGGDGLCGKCRVKVLKGRVNMRKNSFLDDELKEEGYVIACLTEVLSDLMVEVPKDALLKGKPKIGETHPEHACRTLSEQSRYPLSPLCSKLYLELPRPGIADNLSDLDRIERELARKGESPAPTGIDTLKTLAPVMRKGDFKVTVTLADRYDSAEIIRVEPGDTAGSDFGIAVDVGTTTVMAAMIDLQNGAVCAQAADYNSQIRYGEDVITRIIHTQEHKRGLDELQRAVIKDINDLIRSLVRQCGITIEDVNAVVCAGNTTMTHLLLGLPPAWIRKEPYIPVILKPPVIPAANVGIEIGHEGPLYCLPGAGAYVGSDISAGVLTSGMARDSSLGLLIDIGTNGEIVLSNSDFLICCSASAGPAFEGAGTRCSMRATEGAIEKVHISDDDELTFSIIGKEKIPRGICGSGLIDLVAELFKAGMVDRSGRFRTETGNSRIREGEYGKEFIVIDKLLTGADKDCCISEVDIASFIRTKGAIFTAAEALLYHLGHTWDDIETVYISGGFGNDIDIRSAITVGLLPDLPEKKFIFIGNGSLTGSNTCMASREAMKEIIRIAENMTYFNLSTDP